MSFNIEHHSPTGTKLYGGAKEFWQSKDHEVILSGPYETGKTFAVLYKFNALLWKYPNTQALMVREVYNDLVKSAIVTYEKKVCEINPNLPESPIRKYGGERPTGYIYPNGSRIVVAGLDRGESVLSAEYDLIYVNQAEEVPLDTWEQLIGRATGRAGNMPYTQVMGECNPSFPSHWILKRKLAGTLKMFEQHHIHNPMLYDQKTGEITPQGEVSMRLLNSLTGLRYDRGVKGLWVNAEGVIYDNFSPTSNVSTDAEYNPAYPVYWGVDDGYAEGGGVGTPGHHPRVILMANVLPDGRINVFDEYYQTQTLPEASIEEVLSRGYSKPYMAQVDSSASELMRRINAYGITTGKATHRVTEGIKVTRRFICDGQGVRSLTIHPRCENLIRELQSYRYNDRIKNVTGGEIPPLKSDDHACDSLRYLLWNFR